MKRAPVCDLNALPVVLTIDEIASVYRVGISTIRRDLQADVFSPRPFGKFPYRWLRDAVIRDLQTRRPKLQPRGKRQAEIVTTK